ncbi:hypothetical protein E2562_021002 [Oryza meyeriana var. granulata]|uniref:Uncharacterized protein n=1 Tax=Oryza meyeriana var. granulata TaxID=110450 RepID=A0A6G1DZI2_9ORYZ|nr:hypothetical protein E2562_021002 [Oryza meyeriana var. granulata]
MKRRRGGEEGEGLGPIYRQMSDATRKRSEAVEWQAKRCCSSGQVGGIGARAAEAAQQQGMPVQGGDVDKTAAA